MFAVAENVRQSSLVVQSHKVVSDNAYLWCVVLRLPSVLVEVVD